MEDSSSAKQQNLFQTKLRTFFQISFCLIYRKKLYNIFYSVFPFPQFFPDSSHLPIFHPSNIMLFLTLIFKIQIHTHKKINYRRYKKPTKIKIKTNKQNDNNKTKTAKKKSKMKQKPTKKLWSSFCVV